MSDLAFLDGNREVTITLTANEIHLAASHGILRRYEKHLGRRGDRIQKEVSSWDNEIEGACAELAWAKLCSSYWSGVSGLKAVDGAGAEVRWTKHDGGGLIVYNHDSDDGVFILAKGRAPHFRFVGWLTGAEGKLGELTSFGHLTPAHKIRGMNE